MIPNPLWNISEGTKTMSVYTENGIIAEAEPNENTAPICLISLETWALLAKLAKSMGTETVTLRMRSELNAIEVLTSHDHKVQGLIMPIRRDGQ